jgi:hypothetical protein
VRALAGPLAGLYEEPVISVRDPLPAALMAAGIVTAPIMRRIRRRT